MLSLYPVQRGADMEIGAQIAKLRAAKGYTVNKLAMLSGVSQSYLRAIELGDKNPTVEILSVLCDTLGISLKEFFDDGTDGKLASDPLLRRIYQLTPAQREALCGFLDSMKKPD